MSESADDDYEEDVDDSQHEARQGRQGARATDNHASEQGAPMEVNGNKAIQSSPGPIRAGKTLIKPIEFPDSMASEQDTTAADAHALAAADDEPAPAADGAPGRSSLDGTERSSARHASASGSGASPSHKQRDLRNNTARVRDLRPPPGRGGTRGVAGPGPGRGPPRTTFAYIGMLAAGHADLVWAAQASLWAPKSPQGCTVLHNMWARPHTQTFLFFRSLQSTHIMGYAKLESDQLPDNTVASPFSHTGPLFRIRFIILGEYNQRLFADISTGQRAKFATFQDGEEFDWGAGREALARMNHMAQQHRVPKPLDMARAWADRHSIASAGVRQQRASPLGAAAAPMRAAPPAGPPPLARSGGFLNSQRRNAAAPPASAPRGDANGAIVRKRSPETPPEERLAKKRLIDLTYDEYLEVFGRVQEEWWQRQLQAAVFKASNGAVETEEQYLKKCRQNGRPNVSDAAIRAEYRRLIAEHASRQMQGQMP